MTTSLCIDSITQRAIDKSPLLVAPEDNWPRIKELIIFGGGRRNKAMPHFEVYRGSDYNYYWRLRAANGQIVCWSEGYSSLQAARDSVAWVKYNCPGARIDEL